MSILDIIFLFVLLSSLTPLLQRRLLDRARLNAIRTIERARGTRVIALIHRQESMAFLGIPIARFIDIEDSEQVIRAINLTPPDLPIDIILHTPGGLVLAAEQIAHALCRHPAKVTAFIPHYAMSGGTLIALAANEIVMHSDAVLGPVDPQIGGYPAASILELTQIKPVERIRDETLILADMSRKAIRQVSRLVREILTANGMDPIRAEDLATILSTGTWTHDYPIRYEEALEFGLPVSEKMPPSVYDLMDLYPQPEQRRPSVQYVPVPYRTPEQPTPSAPKPRPAGGRRS